MRFINEKDDRLGRSLYLIDDLTQTILEFTLHAGTSLQEANIQRAKRYVLQGWRHIPLGDAQRKALHHRSLAYACLASEDGVVLAAAHEDIDNLANFFVAACYGVDFAVACPRHEIHRKLLQCLLLAHLGWRYRPASLSRRTT